MPMRCHGAVAACIILLAAAFQAHAAPIWVSASPFQACLEGQFDKWVQARAELVLNEDPQAGAIDDRAVAEWAAGILQSCSAQAGGGDAATEARFTKHMARWREHIYDLVQRIRQRAGPD